MQIESCYASRFWMTNKIYKCARHRVDNIEHVETPGKISYDFIGNWMFKPV